MKITWLGQAGLLFEHDGFTVMIDPYLSNSVEKVEPKNYRRVPVDERFFAVKPNVMLFTHHHLDHYDPETAPRFINEQGSLTVLAPHAVWNEVRKLGGNHNYVQFDRHTQWTQGGARFTAVKAEHSEPYAIGVIIEWAGKKYYVTGDTLYNTEIFKDLPADIDVVFLPINGLGNNMNMEDAARFAKQVNAKKTVPLHVGLFDELSAKDFNCPNKVIPEFYKEIKL